MTGFDFSPTAIKEAKRRAARVGVKLELLVQDATTTWLQEDSVFHFAIDCFASTDIESESGRMKAISEMRRVLKPGGMLFSALLSTDDEFHKKMLNDFPGHEKNSFIHTTGKFEKVFDEEELFAMYKGWNLIEARRVKKISRFFDVNYNCCHFWRIYQK